MPEDFSSVGRIRVNQKTGDVTTDVKELTKDGPAGVFYDRSAGEVAKSTSFKCCMQALRRGAE